MWGHDEYHVFDLWKNLFIIYYVHEDSCFINCVHRHVRFNRLMRISCIYFQFCRHEWNVCDKVWVLRTLNKILWIFLLLLSSRTCYACLWEYGHLHRFLGRTPRQWSQWEATRTLEIMHGSIILGGDNIAMFDKQSWLSCSIFPFIVTRYRIWLNIIQSCIMAPTTGNPNLEVSVLDPATRTYHSNEHKCGNNCVRGHTIFQ